MAELSSRSSALEHLYVRIKTENRNLRELREQENHSEHLNMQQGNPISKKNFTSPRGRLELTQKFYKVSDLAVERSNLKCLLLILRSTIPFLSGLHLNSAEPGFPPLNPVNCSQLLIVNRSGQ